MKFDTLGKAVVAMNAIGLDTLDIMIIHLIKVGQWTTVTNLVNECLDIASPAGDAISKHSFTRFVTVVH